MGEGKKLRKLLDSCIWIHRGPREGEKKGRGGIRKKKLGRKELGVGGGGGGTHTVLSGFALGMCGEGGGYEKKKGPGKRKAENKKIISQPKRSKKIRNIG